jgi:superfamily II DNA helicase RecQ
VSTRTPSPKKWPRIGKRIPSEDIKAAIQQIFGYEPRSWQLKLAEKVLEGHDAIGLAGTGAGKSLVFAILAVAAELAEFQGFVLVIYLDSCDSL